MLLQRFDLPTGGVLTAYLHESSPQAAYPICEQRPALIVCPGGGYEHIAFREKDPPAMTFLHMGMQVFALEYDLSEKAKNKKPLEQLARSIQLVRKNSKQWNVDPNRIVVMGFSAGGHLAASLGVHWNDPEILTRCEEKDARVLRPDGMILCYPVITMGQYTHGSTRDFISADSSEVIDYWSLETQVTADTPPAFLWHTMDDALVPVQNSLMLVNAMISAGVSCECHLFPHGPHGMSTCTEEVGTYSAEVGAWVSLCRNWLHVKFGPLPG